MRKLIAPLFLLFLSGCYGTPIAVTRGFVRAHDAIAPAHRKYVTNDLSLSPEQRARKLEVLDNWSRLCDEVEADAFPAGDRFVFGEPK